MEQKTIFQTMVSQYDSQKHKSCRGYRHDDEVLNKFFMISRIQGGRQHYEWLHSNLPGIVPSLSTIETKLKSYAGESPFREGEICIKPLCNYIKENKLCKFVLLAEDATAIQGRREYCCKTDTITGFSLPLKSDGLPDSSSASACSVESIARAFRCLPRATQQMVVMAQPFRSYNQPDPPAFLICTFSTDNTFNYQDTENRIATITEKLQEAGIEVLIYSADGDSRELKLMRMSLRLGFPLSKQGNKSMYSLSDRKSSLIIQAFQIL